MDSTPNSPVQPRPSGLRAALTRLTRSRVALVALSAVVLLAVAGSALGYRSLGTSLTLSVDGRDHEIRTMAGTVADVLEDEGIEVGEHDLVAPDLDEQVRDGGRINVKYGRELTLVVDGEEQTHWVTSTEVDDALGEIGREYGQARLSASRSATIGRDGIELSVVTPKEITVALAGKKPRQQTVLAVTVKEALDQLGVKVDKHDEIRPGKRHQLKDGDRLVFTDIDVRQRTVKGESVAFGTVEREDDSAPEGEETVVREGRAGARDVVYRVVVRNGEVVERKVVSQTVTRRPVDRIVEVGTKQPEPEPAPSAPAANYAGGNTVWDRLAQCESGGNWATNTGNGYYGGLQFSAATWASVGGTGLPHQHSREEQIKRGQILQSRAGWGQWPHCSAQLGLR